MHIKLPMSCFLYGASWDLKILMGAISLQRPLEDVVPENGEFFGP
jgi:hypothetical protein